MAPEDATGTVPYVNAPLAPPAPLSAIVGLCAGRTRVLGVRVEETGEGPAVTVRLSASSREDWPLLDARAVRERVASVLEALAAGDPRWGEAVVRLVPASVG